MSKALRAGATVFVVVLTLGLAAEAQARAILATKGIDTRRSPEVGTNTLTAIIYNAASEQGGARNVIKRREGFELELVVTRPDGTQDTYRGSTKRNVTLKPSRYASGEKVAFENVELPDTGSYVFTVTVPRDENPVEYQVDPRKGSVTRNVNVGGGAQAAQASKLDLVVKLTNAHRVRGIKRMGVRLKLNGQEVDRRNPSGGAGGRFEVRFQNVAPHQTYTVEVQTRGAGTKTYEQAMNDSGAVVTYDLSE